jgi:hypothetical protein
MFVAVLVRRLRPGRTCEDFATAWYPENPDRVFGVGGRGLPSRARRTVKEYGREFIQRTGVRNVEWAHHGAETPFRRLGGGG